MDRPYTSGCNIDWDDDDGSLPDLNSWGCSDRVAVPVKPEEPPASTALSSPNTGKHLSPHLSAPTSTMTAAEPKTDIDALVKRVRAMSMDRPYTPGCNIDRADDDSLPDLNSWGYSDSVATPVKPEAPPAPIPPVPEDVPSQPGTPEVKIKGGPSPGKTAKYDEPGSCPNCRQQDHWARFGGSDLSGFYVADALQQGVPQPRRSPERKAR